MACDAPHHSVGETLMRVLIPCVMMCCLLLSCGGGDESEEMEVAEGETMYTPPSKPTIAPPVVTVDMAKYASEFGASFQAQADAVDKMAQGKTLSIAESDAYCKAQEQMARLAIEMNAILQKNPRWQRAMTEALEKDGKPGIIAMYHAENALKKAKSSGKAGRATGKCPDEVTKLVGDNHLIINRIRGLMPYSKDEMAPPKGK